MSSAQIISPIISLSNILYYSTFGIFGTFKIVTYAVDDHCRKLFSCWL